MPNASHLQTYQRTQILTARPEDLQLILYDGALRFCQQAALAVVAKDRERVGHSLDRARRIILYLSEGLRPDVAPELCALVASAYQFVFRRLVDASLSANTEALDEAVGVLRELREAWAELLSQRSHQAAPDGEQPAAEGGLRLTG